LNTKTSAQEKKKSLLNSSCSHQSTTNCPLTLETSTHQSVSSSHEKLQNATLNFEGQSDPIIGKQKLCHFSKQKNTNVMTKDNSPQRAGKQYEGMHEDGITRCFIV
jgi:hypothetical protein